MDLTAESMATQVTVFLRSSLAEEDSPVLDTGFDMSVSREVPVVLEVVEAGVETLLAFGHWWSNRHEDIQGVEIADRMLIS